MTDASTSVGMSPELRRVAARARREPDAQFHSLAHLLDESALSRAFVRLPEKAAVGIDGVTKEKYGQNLEENLRGLHERLRTKRYRHQPIRRVHIPKENGKTRPLGISAVEDKIVQGALRELLEAVYEQDFLDCSYGYRPRRRPHDAIRAFTRTAGTGRVNWIYEADIASFFDSVDRTTLLDLIRRRVPDGSIRRLVGKCLHVGVLDGEELTLPDAGTAQGSKLSPLLANIYLHYALDLWFTQEVQPHLQGWATLIRFADDFVICLTREDDARRMVEMVPKRLAEFHLKIQPDKTRLIPFRRPPRSQQHGKGPGSFDFLGFTHYWRRSRRGQWVVACKTRCARLRRAAVAISEYCRKHRHDPVADQHIGLSRRMRGHYQYYGVNGNVRALARLYYLARRMWHKWLNRRSQRGRLNWKRFTDGLFKHYPLPRPRVYVQIWGR
jgi:group II intron reverse transcriptase/maturase